MLQDQNKVSFFSFNPSLIYSNYLGFLVLGIVLSSAYSLSFLTLKLTGLLDVAWHMVLIPLYSMWIIEIFTFILIFGLTYSGFIPGRDKHADWLS
jgi:hypothetical protein